MVDLDASENEFIKRMQNTCSYYPGAVVLPLRSLLYCKFTVLNEINNLKINGMPISVEAKQGIYNDVFMAYSTVKVKHIKDYLCSQGLMTKNDELSGIDIKINSQLYSQHKFKRLLETGILSETDAERIIARAAYSEDKYRLIKWLRAEYPALDQQDCKYIAGLNLKEFGRLSREFLTGITGADRSTEAFTIIEGLWNTNDNLMQLLSERYTFSEELENISREYYAEYPRTLSDRLGELYVSNAVKRPIYRTLDICEDIQKAMGCAPDKIFVEMARGANEEQKNKRTRTRLQQLEDLYKSVKTADAVQLRSELAAMGDMADNRLQSDKLFLYYLQLGKCAYTGASIELEKLANNDIYNIDHIYPQSYVKDDSLINNKVLVLSTVNGSKRNEFPVAAAIRNKMQPIWHSWKEKGLMSDEKYRRLTRATAFTDDEKLAFINRQLVETRQSTKAAATILQEKYPGAELVYVKAGLVSDFRQQFDMIKCRSVNNLHHARDAYLNIVVGNVYNSKFTKNFNVHQEYNVQVKKLFTSPVKCSKSTVWQGGTDIEKVRRVMAKNAIHITRYSFCRKGGLFDMQPVKKKEGLTPLKSGMDTAKYGGYNKASASFFVPVKYTSGKKSDIMIMPVELLAADRFQSDAYFAVEYAKQTIGSIIGKEVNTAERLLGSRIIKSNTVISVDGLRLLIRGKSSGGAQILLSHHTPLILARESETYIKALDSFLEKRRTNTSIQVDYIHDGISVEKNIALYNELRRKLSDTIFKHSPGNQRDVLSKGSDNFKTAGMIEQIQCLVNIVAMLSTVPGTFDMTVVGGSKNAGSKLLSSRLSNWAKNYTDVRIIDQSASGLFESKSANLLDLL